MLGCASGSLLLVNAGVDSMGGVIDGGVEISSAPSPQKSSDLEKTQAKLRDTFSAAEKFRKELEFLQKGGDPLDLKVGTAASVSLQSTSLTDQHPEQFVTSELKGSFAITTSPHGDSVDSSGRLGALSVGEPNSADNLMLFDGDNKFREVDRRLTKESGESVALELPKKSYKRRIRSRPNRHASRDTKGLAHNAESQEHKDLSNSNSNPKITNLGLALKNLDSNSLLDIKSNGTQTQIQETPLSIDSVEPVGHVEQETLLGSEHPLGVDTHTVADVAFSGQTKGFDSKSSCSQSVQSLDGNNDNEVPTSVGNVNPNGTMEVNLASKEDNDGNTVKDDKILSINSDDNEIGSSLKEEERLKGSETSLQHELKKSGAGLDGCTTSDIERKPLGTDCTSFQESTLSLRSLEQNECNQNNLKLATKEHEDSILEEARIIEEKRKRIAGLSVGVLKSECHHRSHWHFVLEEMSWLANDFAQERLWKVTAAAQISRKAAYTSRLRFQKQNSSWKQKEVAHTLAKAVMEFWGTVQVKCQGSELEGTKKDSMVGLHRYGVRFLEYNNSNGQYSSAQAPVTPDLGITDISWEDNLTEENLFYVVSHGAIEAYRKAIESHLLQSERTGSSMQEEVDAINGYDDVADNTLEEDEGETSTYYLPGAFEGSRLPKTTQKKRKHSPHFRSYGARSYETGADMSFPQSLERNIGTQPSVLSGKRPASSINISIPTKRVRTAPRPRFTGTSGYNNINNNNQAPNRTDASSGDTNSFQDEQSSLHGGYQIPNNMEAESVGDYEKQLHFDMTEVSNRPKKKKKGSTFDHRWQLDSDFQSDQKEHSKRRLDARQFDSNGNSVASQTSNMSNPNKFMKLLVRDRGRKAKSLKTPVGQPGSGSPWSLFEDQALVVLVHDMGANWELISDAINSTLQFKCISRNSKECKERHKILMDRSTGDGADSAEDSGSSQPYPSTLPGIPEGSARQLFQRLQGPMEEDTLKSHFEKIIVFSRKLHYNKSQKDNQDPKQLQQPHGSHALALSQVCPNNLNGGPVLTPLDLCEPISSSPDFLSAGYQVPHTGAPMVPGSSPSSSLPGSSSLAFGTHLTAPSPPISPSVREGRYAIPRTGSLPMDDQHRMQHYNQMLSARNMQPSSLPPGPHPMTPGGTGMGVMSAMNRGMMMARPINPPAMIRNPDHQQGGTTQGIPAYAFPNQNPQPPVQPYPMSPHMPHHPPRPPTNSQHPAFGMRLMKERQLQQQRLRQQQFASSNPVSPHVQPQPQQSQLPVSSPQSNTQIQSQSQSPSVTQRNLQTGGNTVKPQRRPPQQLHPPGGRQQPQLAAKVLKGGGKGTPGDRPSNGFVGEKGEMHHVVQSGGQGNLYSGPSGLNPNPLLQKRFPGQPLQQKSKLANQSQLTVAQKMALQNRKASPSDLSTSKLQARGVTMPLPLTKPSQTSCDDVAPVSGNPNMKKTEPFGDSSGKVKTGMSPTAEHSGPPAVNSS